MMMMMMMIVQGLRHSHENNVNDSGDDVSGGGDD